MNNRDKKLLVLCVLILALAFGAHKVSKPNSLHYQQEYLSLDTVRAQGPVKVESPVAQTVKMQDSIGLETPMAQRVKFETAPAGSSGLVGAPITLSLGNQKSSPMPQALTVGAYNQNGFSVTIPSVKPTPEQARFYYGSVPEWEKVLTAESSWVFKIDSKEYKLTGQQLADAVKAASGEVVLRLDVKPQIQWNGKSDGGPDIAISRGLEGGVLGIGTGVVGSVTCPDGYHYHPNNGTVASFMLGQSADNACHSDKDESVAK